MIKIIKKLFGIKEQAYETTSIEKELENVYFSKRC